MTLLRKLFIVAAMVLPMTSFATDYPWLTFLLVDNTEVSVASGGLEVNYSDGNLLLTSSSVNQTIPVTQIKSMRFTSSSSGIDNINVDEYGLVEYYTVSGMKVGEFRSLDEARKVLPTGVYVGKAGVKTYKVIF